jgi:hypothetical protein
MTQQKVNGYVVTPAPAKSGHPYWNVRCDCGKEQVVRVSRVKSGEYRCLCRRETAKDEKQATLQTLAADISALHDAIMILTQLVKQGATQAKPLTKLASLAPPPRKRFTKVDLLAGAADSAAAQERMQANRDWIAQHLTFDKSVRDDDMLHDRMAIEQASAELDPDPTRGADRLRQLSSQRKKFNP